MVNGLGVLGWGVGGIEAEAAMLGQPVSMLIPQVLGFKLHGEMPAGTTATDLVLTVTERLRERGVVGKFVEFYGAGLASLPIADRATIGNMSPEFGSTCAIFPIDSETIDYLRLTGRPEPQIALVEAYAREQGLWHDEESEEPTFSDHIELDLGEVEPSLAGPRRPQDRIPLRSASGSFRDALAEITGRDGAPAPAGDAHDEAEEESYPASDPPANGVPGYHAEAPAEPLTTHTAGAPGATVAHELERSHSAQPVTLGGETFELDHGDVVIAAITSCTNTSNPSVMVGAGVLARNAVARGLRSKPWVKTSLAPGSKVVTEYLDRAGLTEPLERARLQPRRLRLHDLHRQLGAAAGGGLQGRRRGRPGGRLGAVGQPQLRGPDQPRREDELPRLAAPVRGLRDRRHDGHRHRRGAARTRSGAGARCTCATSGPPSRRSPRRSRESVRADMFRKSYGEVFTGDERWRGLPVPEGERFALGTASTYVRLPPYFEDMPAEPAPATRDRGRPRARAAGRQRHHRPHLSRRLDQARQPCGRPTCRSRAWGRATSTPTAPGAATTR